MKIKNDLKTWSIGVLILGCIFFFVTTIIGNVRPFKFGIYLIIGSVLMLIYIEKNIRIITKIQQTEIEQELFIIIKSILSNLNSITYDLERECRNDILNKKISDSFGDSSQRLSLRDRYGNLCTESFNAAIGVAEKTGIDVWEFYQSIGKIIGDSHIYNGSYNTFSIGLSDSGEEITEVHRGQKEWWKIPQKDKVNRYRKKI